MNCGISLPINYLAGKPLNDEDFLFLKHNENPLILLQNLKEAGVTSIELRAIEAETDLKIASLAANRVLESGLNLTIHGYFPNNKNCHRFSEYLPPIASIVETLKNYKTFSTMTLHTHRSRNTNLAKAILGRLKHHFGELLAETVVSYNVKIDEAQSHGQPVLEYSPRSKGATMIRALGEELLSRGAD